MILLGLGGVIVVGLLYLAYGLLAIGRKLAPTPLQEKTQHPILTSLTPRYVMVSPLPQVQEQVEAWAMVQAARQARPKNEWVLLLGYQIDAQGQEKRN